MLYVKVHLSVNEPVNSEAEAEKVDVPSNASETELSALDEILSVPAGGSTPVLDEIGDGGGQHEKKVIRCK